MARDPLRIGVIGIGALALRAILPHLTQPDIGDSVAVTALCDPVTERLLSAAERFHVEATFTDVRELVASDLVDAVTVVSPIGLHYEHCKLALLAGKHVHVNKTMTTTVAEADELIELAHEREVRIVASPGEILRPQIARTRELIAEGAIGTVAWAICGTPFESYHELEEPERAGEIGGTPINPTWYFRKPGGGPLYDMTVYALHQLTGVLGPARRVTALSAIRIPERSFLGEPIRTEADDNTIVLLDFGGGLFAVAFGTVAGALTDQFGAALYFGTKGTIEGVLLNGKPFDFPGRELTTHAPPSDWDAQMRVLPHVVGSHRELPEAHVFEDIMQLVDLVREGVPTPVTAEHARHVIEIIEKAYRAAEGGAAHELTTTFELPGGLGSSA
jgi:predicted dehydrogenase